MSFLGKLFGAKPGIDKLRRMVEQGGFAEALHLAEDLVAAGDGSAELEELRDAAANGLARRNLEEGERQQRAGQTVDAREHLQLALSQARDAELVARIEAALAPASVDSPPEDETGDAAAEKNVVPASGDCDGCRPPLAVADIDPADLPDQQAQLELVLAGYPPELQERYLAGSPDFQRAFLLSQNGEEQKALELLQQLPRQEGDEVLCLFELGSLHARLGKTDRGEELLSQALALEAGNLLVIDALLALLLQRQDTAAALDLLHAQLACGADAAFCQARLCEVFIQAQDLEAAFIAARSALESGFAEPDFLLQAAGLFERNGQLEEAERLLLALPGGGCGGGANLHLAEFWLRQERELGRVLDSFNAACRQEPDNPRWQLRVAQTYLVRNWHKQGLELLQRVAGDPRLETPLRREAERLLAEI